MNDNLHAGHRERVRQDFFNNGIDEKTPPHKILEMLLFYCVRQKDTNPLAHQLIDKFKNLSGVLEAPVSELTKFSGITENGAALLKMILPIARICAFEKRNDKYEFDSIDKIGEFLLEQYMGFNEERLSVLGMDGIGRRVCFEFVADGDISTVGVSTRDIIKIAIESNATAMVMCHNHPSGIPLPSQQDEMITKTVVQALSHAGVRLIDHIIIGGGDYISLLQSEKYRYIFMK